MKISILIAARQAAATMPRALAGIRSQLHDDWDLWVVENGADARAHAVVRTFASGRPYVRQLITSGRTTSVAMRNRLLELAAGDAIAFLEPTDEWTPRHLLNAVARLETGADVVISDGWLSGYGAGRESTPRSMPGELASHPTRALFARDLIAGVSSVVLRRTMLAAVGGLDPAFTVLSERDFWLRCAAAGARFACSGEKTCRCRVDGEVPALTKAEETVQFYEKHRDLAAIPAAVRRRLLAGSLVALGRLLRATEPSDAARCFRRAWALQPVPVQTLGQFALTGWHSPAKPDGSDK